jgi:hypothetical protein
VTVIGILGSHSRRDRRPQVKWETGILLRGRRGGGVDERPVGDVHLFDPIRLKVVHWRVVTTTDAATLLVVLSLSASLLKMEVSAS